MYSSPNTTIHLLLNRNIMIQHLIHISKRATRHNNHYQSLDPSSHLHVCKVPNQDYKFDTIPIESLLSTLKEE